MSARSDRQTSLVALRRVANNTKITVTVNSRTFWKGNSQTSHSVHFFLNDQSVCILKFAVPNVCHVETHNAVRHSVTACCCPSDVINLLKPTGYVMHQQFNIQQLYALPTLYLCVLYLSENKLRLVPLTA